ncbi:MAG TPA: cbb3-type cytochrome c oxidase subunit I [Candidatus Dormibacteraeota bacterium]|nr:cbb3-type cytochrome c oxidase subunit I [Candidatus Dormibacteraeota bacterium]
MTAIRPLGQRFPHLVPSIVSGTVLGLVASLLAGPITSALVGGPRGGDAGVVAGYIAWALFFMVGIGAVGEAVQWGSGRANPTHEQELVLAGSGAGLWRYFRFTTDHKVVGVQYLATVLVLFLVGGLAAFLIRLQQSQPGASYFKPAFYNTMVGVHGTVMIAAVIIMSTSTFGNFMLPILIGARDMAFPRLNALSYWILFSAIPVFLSTLVLGGFQTGWTGYAPLADQQSRFSGQGLGMDAYSFTIILFAMSTALSGVNIVTTMVTMRTRGMFWNRIPLFVWGATLSVLLGLVVFPSFMLSQVMVLMDRVLGTSFFIANLGGSNWLYEQLFWFMGHPEVYVIALPSLAVAADISAVFNRKPVFGYRLFLGGMFAICLLSLLVWAHHLYLSGANTALNGAFMLNTELISIPTGAIFFVLIGTFWRGRVWVTVPLLFVLGLLSNFIIGGVTGLYLADVPTDVMFHGGMFVTAHFHFTLVGGMVFGFFAAFYYWFPKIFGRRLNPALGRLHFWLFEVGFLGTFLALFYAGLQGEPRWMAIVPRVFAGANLVASLFTILLALSVVVFGYNVISSLLAGRPAAANEWGGNTLEWRVPTPVPLENFEELPVVTGWAHDPDNVNLAPGHGKGGPEMGGVAPALQG